MEKKPDCPYDRTQFKKLLELSSLNVPFRFLDKNYVQQDGVAMGSPIAPILADIFISKLEEKLNRFTTNKPKIWYRYVDDVICIFNKKQNIKDFLTRINKWHLNIHFTIEYENNERLPFLDLLIIRSNNKFVTTVYRKPTTTNLYLLYDSSQARKYKLGLIKSLYVRSLRLCSDYTYLKIERDHLIKILQQNGYPLHIIKRGIKEANAIYKRLNNPPSKPQPQIPKTKEIYFVLSYYGHESIELGLKIRKICNKYLPNLTINLAYKKSLTLRNIFLPRQKGNDETKKQKKLVYAVNCKDCDSKYIGETNRKKTTRMKEHKNDIKKDKLTSLIAQHCNINNHRMDIDNAETLSLESIWKRRVIKESLLTHYTHGKAINEVKYKLKVFG